MRIPTFTRTSKDAIPMQPVDQEMLDDHQRTWNGFTRFVLYSTVVVGAALRLMALLLI